MDDTTEAATTPCPFCPDGHPDPTLSTWSALEASLGRAEAEVARLRDQVEIVSAAAETSARWARTALAEIDRLRAAAEAAKDALPDYAHPSLRQRQSGQVAAAAAILRAAIEGGPE